MFSTIVVSLLSVLLLTPEALSKPLSSRRSHARKSVAPRSNSPVSFNNWQGISSLDGFDSFYGVSNFDGSQNSQVVVVEEQEEVCETVQVDIIQQQLVVLQEFAKQIITQQICEVETQTIVFQQFYNSLGLFQSDLLRQSNRQVGFDSNISKHLSQLVNSDGSLSSADLGFSGSSVGSNTVVFSGNNWNSESSESVIEEAISQVQIAVQSSSAVVVVSS